MSISDKELQTAYKKSQQSYVLDEDIKQRVLMHNKKQKTTSLDSLGYYYERFMSVFDTSVVKLTAVSFALVVMFGTYYVGQWQAQRLGHNGTAELALDIVHYHGFEGEENHYEEMTSRAKFNTYTEHYYERQSLANAVSTQRATLYEDDGNWLLVNCQNEKVIVSQTLLASLNTFERITGDIKVGTAVSLAYDRQGKILSIRSSAKPLIC
ncbi:hypothetical protein [Alteromonas gracilis]|uniref:hypothetical protein n=1 Tax=Alteromonas gracilis TaxID=1479524 RepID=UPI0030CE30A3